VNYRCPICTRLLEPYGTGGMTCSEGHHFSAAEVRRDRPAVRKVAGREVSVRPWLPGAVLGGLALLIEVVRVLVEAVS
jgi:hypothetical protein